MVAGISSMSRPAIRTLPAGGVDLADQHLDQGRLAAAGGADDEGELAAVDRERDALEPDVAARVDDGRVAQLDDRRAEAVGPVPGLLTAPLRSSGALAPLACPESGHAQSSFCGVRAIPAPGPYRPEAQAKSHLRVANP